jgi:hypothetical protein
LVPPNAVGIIGRRDHDWVGRHQAQASSYDSLSAQGRAALDML